MTGAELQLHAVNYLPTRGPGQRHTHLWGGPAAGGEEKRVARRTENDSGSRVPVVGSNCNKLTALITPRSDQTFPGDAPVWPGLCARDDRTIIDRRTAVSGAFYGPF